ncbi:MAG: sulfatase [Candidatus Binatia bacterium]|nr:sulfatase [Candidatus Binatia bacterium]HAC81415.1 hypothetical protein [Deltaproteobacteria bacterium]
MTPIPPHKRRALGKNFPRLRSDHPGSCLWMGLACLLWMTTTAWAVVPTVPAFDLVGLVAGDEQPQKNVEAVMRGAHGQTRTAVRMKIPAAAGYPVKVPENAILQFGISASALVFAVESPELSQPVTARIWFDDESGSEVIYQRRIKLKDRSEDRTWFDEKVDLGKLAGRSGTLRFETSSEVVEEAEISVVYWSTPRITQTRASLDSPNLLFITIDCLRADHVGAYGYPHPTTPTIDGLSEKGIRFAHAYANAPMTLPSIPQIFTSQLFPSRDEPLLTAPFSDAGIPSAAFINNAWIPLWLSQGAHADPPGTFDRIISGALTADNITDQALAWLSDHEQHRFALYLHFLDAHTPYRPPARWRDVFVDKNYRGPVGDTFKDDKGAAAGKYNAADQKKIIALYDAGIRYIDSQIDRLLQELKSKKIFDDTLIVISADHGEELWDHGSFFHGQSLYEELLHIPLVVKLPGGAESGRVVERTVQGIDLAPSILDWMNLPSPDQFQGEKLGRTLDQTPRDFIATATQAQFPTRYAIRRGHTKIVESLNAAEVEGYDLEADPGEAYATLPEGTTTAELMRDLRQARSILRERGFQMQVTGADNREIEIEMSSAPVSATFLTLDRRGEKGVLQLSPDGRRLQIRGPATGFGLRFDRLKDSNNLGNRDLVAFSDRNAAGKNTPLRISLGASGKRSDAATVDLNSADLESPSEPPCDKPERGIHLCLWHYPGEKVSALPEIKDPALRERLRALGYIQ